ncbi:MAG: EAL domain-containing protein [Pseudomonadales bacterium]
MPASNTSFILENPESSIALSHFIIAINEASSEQEIYCSLATHLPELLPAERCSVTLLNPEKTTLEIFSLHGSEGALPVGKSLPFHYSNAGIAIKEKTSKLNILDPSNLFSDCQLLLQQGIKSTINAPLIISGQAIGSVNIGCKQEHLYTTNSVALMSLVASLLSTYLERQQLLEQTRHSMQGYRHYSQQLEILNRCANSLSIAKNEHEVFSSVAQSIKELVPAKRTSFVTPIKGSTEFKIRHLSEINQTLPSETILAKQNSIFSMIMREGRPIFLKSFKDLSYFETKLLAESGLVCGWCIPIYIQKQVVGVLSTATDQPVDDGENSNELLAAIGSVMGASLERLKVQKQLHHQAHHDTLTGLANRTQFNKTLNNFLTNKNNIPFALLYIDLDNFKSTNDSLGHDIGDSLLCSVTQRIRYAVPDIDLVARLGGDEFIIIAPNLENDEAAAQIASNIIDSLQSPFHIKGHKLFIGASIGISLYPHHGNTSSDLIKFADIAMYHAKGQGRNNYQFFTQALSEKINQQQHIDNALRHAISNNELHLLFQPLIEADKVQGVEALLRWTSQDIGPIGPAEFIPIAEESLIIEDLTYWVLNESLATLKELRRHQPDLFVAVNISAKVFLHSKHFVDVVRNTLKQYDLPSSALELEITENVFLNNIIQTKQQLNELRKDGVRIAIDDFGTGFSSLTYLLDLPLDTLKIDRSFVEGVENDSKKAGVIKAIIAFSKSLQLSCIAEGVETEAQKICLQNLGCERFQGYLFSRPLSVDKLQLHLATYAL